MTSQPEAEVPMMLTDTEWRHLAHLCRRYLQQTADIPRSFPPADVHKSPDVRHIYERRALCERIIRAAG